MPLTPDVRPDALLGERECALACEFGVDVRTRFCPSVATTRPSISVPTGGATKRDA